MPERDGVRQLVVGGEPMLMLAGELGNSSASSLAYMEPIWPRLAKLDLNTVLAPVYWELIEPEQGRFDFALVDGLIEQARAHELRLVLL
jgi:beta-galactosidase GanA